jgi:hypothetical protein
MRKKAKPPRQEKGPLETRLEPRPLAPGLLYDMRPGWDLNALKKVVAFAKQAGIDPQAEDFCCRLAWYLLRKHEPAFQPEKRGRRQTIRSEEAKRARLELLDLFEARRDSRGRHTPQLTITAFAKWALKNKQKLPAYFRNKIRLSARMLSDAIALAQKERSLWGDSEK